MKCQFLKFGTRQLKRNNRLTAHTQKFARITNPLTLKSFFVEFPDGELNFYRRKSEILYSEGSKDYNIESCKLAKLDSGN